MSGDESNLAELNDDVIYTIAGFLDEDALKQMRAVCRAFANNSSIFSKQLIKVLKNKLPRKIYITSGGIFICLFDAEGNTTVFVCGENRGGQLGVGDYESRFEPVEAINFVPPGHIIENIQGTGSSTLVVTRDKSEQFHVFVCGGFNNEIVKPKEILHCVPSGHKVISIDEYWDDERLCTEQYMLTLGPNGKTHVFEWSKQKSGALGLDYNSELSDAKLVVPKPGKLGNISGGAQKFTIHESHFGQLITQEIDGKQIIIFSRAEKKGRISKNIIKNIPADHIITYIKYSYEIGCVITLDSDNQEHIFTWGNNRYGRLGLGHTDDVNVNIPTKIPTFFPKDQKIIFLDFKYELTFLATKDENGDVHVYSWGLAWGTGAKGRHATPDGMPMEIPNCVPKRHSLLSIKIMHENFVEGARTLFNVFMITQSPLGQCHLFTWGETVCGEYHNRRVSKSIDTPEEIVGAVPENHIVDKIINLKNGSFLMFVSDFKKNVRTYGWGANIDGLLCQNHKKPILTPTEIHDCIPKDYSIDKIFVGEGGSVSIVALDPDGCAHLINWGNNREGSLGHGAAGAVFKPTELLVPKQGQAQLAIKAVTAHRNQR